MMQSVHPELAKSPPPEALASSAETVSARIAEAMEMARNGEAERALSGLDSVIAAAPDAIEGWQAKARVLQQGGRFREGAATLDKALAQIGVEPNLLREKAALHLMDGDFSQAQKTLDQLIAVEPDSVVGWLGKGWLQLNENKPEPALECAERVLRSDAQSVLGHMLHGDCLLRLRRWADAFAAFSDAAEKDPSEFNAASWGARGDEFRQNGEMDFALRAYNRALTEDSANPSAWYGKGLVLKERQEFDDALSSFEKAYTLDGSFVAAMLDAGALCFWLGKSDRALDLFRKAEVAQPDDPRPWKHIGWVHESRSQSSEAQAAYERALAIDPRDAETWNSLGNVCYRQERLDAAGRAYRSAIEASAGYAWPHFNLAFVHLKQRHFDEAMRCIDKALELEAGNPDFWCGKLAILDFTIDSMEPGKVEAYVEEALAAAGDNPNVRLSVAGFLQDCGHLDRAREMLDVLEPAELGNDEARLSLGANLIETGLVAKAVDLLLRLDPSQLSGSSRVVLRFYLLIADGLTGAHRISEQRLGDYIHEFRTYFDQMKSTERGWNFLNVDWCFKGTRRFLADAELSITEKLVLWTLLDLQESKIDPENLSFLQNRETVRGSN